MLTDGEHKYLKAVYMLGGSKEFVKMSKLAETLRVKAPTVIRVLQGLAVKGFVKITPRVGAALTEEGVREVLSIIHRHGIVEVFLCEMLGLTVYEAHEEASKLETRISNRTCERLCTFLKRPGRSPCGMEIIHHHT